MLNILDDRGSPLSYPPVADTVCLHNSEHPGLHSIPRQDIKTVVPIEGSVGLVQVEEYGMEELLPHGNYLLK